MAARLRSCPAEATAAVIAGDPAQTIVCAVLWRFPGACPLAQSRGALLSSREVAPCAAIDHLAQNTRIHWLDEDPIESGLFHSFAVFGSAIAR